MLFRGVLGVLTLAHMSVQGSVEASKGNHLTVNNLRQIFWCKFRTLGGAFRILGSIVP